MVWDYNVGLVRMTPFFKSLKYSKVSKSVPWLEHILTVVDNTSQGSAGESGAERHQLQYNRRRSRVPRSVPVRMMGSERTY